MRSRIAVAVALCSSLVAGGCRPLPSTVPDAEAVIADLTPEFLRCYEDELASSPTVGGNVRLEARVDVFGRVADVDLITDGGLGPAVLACLERHMRSAQFSKPDLGTATIEVSMSFAPAPR